MNLLDPAFSWSCKADEAVQDICAVYSKDFVSKRTARRDFLSSKKEFGSWRMYFTPVKHLNSMRTSNGKQFRNWRIV